MNIKTTFGKLVVEPNLQWFSRDHKHFCWTTKLILSWNYSIFSNIPRHQQTVHFLPKHTKKEIEINLYKFKLNMQQVFFCFKDILVNCCLKKCCKKTIINYSWWFIGYPNPMNVGYHNLSNNRRHQFICVLYVWLYMNMCHTFSNSCGGVVLLNCISMINCNCKIIILG